MPGAEKRFKPFVDFVRTCGWETEFVRLDWPGKRPPFGSTEIFPQVDAQTAGKLVFGFSLGALYAHLGALHAKHLILGSISPFFLEDAQMHRRAEAVRDFYRQHTYTNVAKAEHELWHPNYLQAIKTALDRLKGRPTK